MFRVVVWVVLGGVALVFAGCSEESGRGRNAGDGDAFLVGIAEVVDGDSLTLGGEEVRLLGIDAPEYGQICGEGEKIWRCGEVAKEMEERISGLPQAWIMRTARGCRGAGRFTMSGHDSRTRSNERRVISFGSCGYSCEYSCEYFCEYGGGGGSMALLCRATLAFGQVL